MDYGIEQRARERFARSELEAMGRLTDQLERELAAQATPPGDLGRGVLRALVAGLLAGLIALACLTNGPLDGQPAVPTQPTD